MGYQTNTYTIDLTLLRYKCGFTYINDSGDSRWSSAKELPGDCVAM